VEAGIADIRSGGQGDGRAVDLVLTRTGQRSLYGDVEVYLLGSGEPRRIGQLRGVGVYPEVSRRPVRVALAEDAPQLAAGSRLRVVYKDDDFKPGAVLAQADVSLP
jgi:hypothetical protein